MPRVIWASSIALGDELRVNGERFFGRNDDLAPCVVRCVHALDHLFLLERDQKAGRGRAADTEDLLDVMLAQLVADVLAQIAHNHACGLRTRLAVRRLVAHQLPPKQVGQRADGVSDQML